MCLTHRHSAVTPVSLLHATPRSPAKHSAAEPLRSHITSVSSQGLSMIVHLQVIPERSLLSHTQDMEDDESHAGILKIPSVIFFSHQRISRRVVRTSLEKQLDP